MNIIHSSLVESCLDGSATVEYVLDTEITRSFIGYLGRIGRTEYFPRFARPFFRISRTGSFLLKGVEGDTILQVVYFRSSEELERELLFRIRLYSPDVTGRAYSVS